MTVDRKPRDVSGTGRAGTAASGPRRASEAPRTPVAPAASGAPAAPGAPGARARNGGPPWSGPLPGGGDPSGHGGYGGYGEPYGRAGYGRPGGEPGHDGPDGPGAGHGGPYGHLHAYGESRGYEAPAPDRMQAILDATKHVAGLLKAAGHPFALAGGVAAYAHGNMARLEHDADFCVLPEDAEAVAGTLRKAGLPVYDPPEDWLFKARCRGQDVDLIYELKQLPVTPELLGRAEILPVDSVVMPVLAPTDLLIGLLNALSEHHCDFSAVLPLARTLREKIDWVRVRRVCGTAPMPDAFLYLLERLGVIAPRGPGPAAADASGSEDGSGDGDGSRPTPDGTPHGTPHETPHGTPRAATPPGEGRQRPEGHRA
ncbi:hypothetical protein [Streptomyces albus]|uniref:hypothetical protein n=1 Tax=Streptomyces albus TaxID=1888 RepID=UPI000A853536